MLLLAKVRRVDGLKVHCDLCANKHILDIWDVVDLL